MFTDDLEVFSGVEGDTLAPLEFTEMFIEGRDEFDEVDNWDKKKSAYQRCLFGNVYLLAR